MKLSDATSLYVGSDEVAKVYLGEDEVWSKGGPEPEGLEGEVTVGNFEFSPGTVIYGWSSGAAVPVFGGISGEAASYLDVFFYWAEGQGGFAATTEDLTGAVLTFQGESAICAYDGNLGAYGFPFPVDVSAWPKSGTHKFWLLLPE